MARAVAASTAPTRDLATPLAAFVAVLWLTLPACLAEPCADRPDEHVVHQFTKEDCTCCFDLDEFIQDNDYVYVLFYSVQGRLNIDINAKFEQLAADWKWSRMHFGRIDVDRDREMSTKWVEQGMVPTNVMYKFGRPVEVQPKDFEQIRDKYQGSAEGQKWMLTKYMGEDAEGSNLHYTSALPTTKKYKKFVKANEIAIIGFFKREGDRPYQTFNAAVWQLYQDIDRDDLGASMAMVTSAQVAKKQNAHVPSVLVYLDGALVEDGGNFTARKWAKDGVMDFLRQFLPLTAQEPVDGVGANEEL